MKSLCIFAACLILVISSAALAQRPSADYVAAVYEHVSRTAFRPNVTRHFALKIMNDNLDVYEKQMAIASRKVCTDMSTIRFFQLFQLIIHRKTY